MAITDYVDLPKTGSDLANNVPLVSEGKEVVEAAGSGDIGSLTADVGSFAMGALGAAADPLNALISAGLGFLEDWCKPVKSCLEQVTGKPDELGKNKEAFSDVAEDLKKLSDDLDQITKSGFQNWNGDAKDSASQAIDTFIQGVNGTANNATDIASILGVSATLMDAAKEIINGILSTLIEWLIVTWVAALACSWFTFGASDAAAAAATPVEAGVEGANAADKVEETSSFIDRIVNVIKNIIEKLKSIAKDPKGFKNEVKSNHALLKEGKDALPAAEKDGAKAAENAGKDGGKAAEHSGEGGSEGSAGDSESSSPGDKPNFFQNKWNEAKEGAQSPVRALQENATGRSGQNAGQYLTTKGESGPSPLGDIIIDAGINTGAKITGTLDDGALDQEDGSGGESSTIDQDLKG